MLFSGDLAVFMQPRCCLVAVKSIFDGSKPNQIPPKGRAKVPPGTVEHPEGAESLAALTAGWPPCKKEIWWGNKCCFFYSNVTFWSVATYLVQSKFKRVRCSVIRNQYYGNTVFQNLHQIQLPVLTKVDSFPTKTHLTHLEFSRAYVCQESSPMGAFSSQRSWMKW